MDLVSRWQAKTPVDPYEPAPKKTCAGQGRVSGVAVQDSSRRSDGLLRRFGGGKQKRLAAPYSFCRKVSKRWLKNLDNPFRNSMRTGGLKSFVRNDGIRVLLQQDAFNLLPDTEWGRS